MKERVFYIPQNFKIGRLKSNHNQVVVTCKSTDGHFIQAETFKDACGYYPYDKLSNDEDQVLRDISNSVETLENQLVSGFQVITCPISDSYIRSYLLVDPRGFTWRISDLAILYTIIDCNTSIDSKGYLKGKFCYALSKNSDTLYLLKDKCDDYKNAITYKDFCTMRNNISSTMSKKKLKVGSIYRWFYNSDLVTTQYIRCVYLGELENVYPYVKIRGWLSSQSLYDLKELYNYMLHNKHTKRMVFLKLCDTITSNRWTYVNNNYVYNGSDAKPNEVLEDLSYFIKSPANNHEFITRHLIIVSKLDTSMCRQLDDKQEIRVIREEVDKAYTNFLRDQIIRAMGQTPATWQYQEYKVEDIIDGVKSLYSELRKTVIQQMKNHKLL